MVEALIPISWRFRSDAPSSTWDRVDLQRLGEAPAELFQLGHTAPRSVALPSVRSRKPRAFRGAAAEDPNMWVNLEDVAQLGHSIGWPLFSRHFLAQI